MIVILITVLLLVWDTVLCSWETLLSQCHSLQRSTAVGTNEMSGEPDILLRGGGQES